MHPAIYCIAGACYYLKKRRDKRRNGIAKTWRSGDFDGQSGMIGTFDSGTPTGRTVQTGIGVVAPPLGEMFHGGPTGQTPASRPFPQPGIDIGGLCPGGYYACGTNQNGSTMWCCNQLP